MQGFNPALPIAPYIRRIDLPGGELKRAFLYALFRLTSKGTSFIDADIDALRLEQSKWDSRVVRVNPAARRAPLAGTSFAGEWIDTADSLPGRIILYLRGAAFMFRWPAIYTAMLTRWCTRLATIRRDGRETDVGVRRYAPNSRSDIRGIAVTVADTDSSHYPGHLVQTFTPAEHWRRVHPARPPR
jgi:hypothetical protein